MWELQWIPMYFIALTTWSVVMQIAGTKYFSVGSVSYRTSWMKDAIQSPPYLIEYELCGTNKVY